MQKLRRCADLAVLVFFLSGVIPTVIPAAGSDFTALAQSDVGQRAEELSSRVDRMESRRTTSAGAAVAFLFAAFCALWAQNTKRNPWAWFFLGMFFNVIAVLVLLAKNADDLKAGGGAAAGSGTVALAVALGALVVITFFLLYWGSV